MCKLALNESRKDQRSLNHIMVRGLRKFTAHCYLSVIAMQAVNLGKLKSTPESPQIIEEGPYQPRLIGIGGLVCSIASW